MHKSRSIIETIWWKRNWWSIGEISRRRWSISSCRHIFALRQKVKKNCILFFSSWHVLLPTLFFVRVSTSIVWLVWCGYVKISLPSSSYTFFSFSFARFYGFSSFFLCSSSTSLLQSDDVSWTYIQPYRWKMCSFCAPICHSGIHVMYSSEEIMFLCVQSNHFSSLSLIIRYE